MGCCSHKNCDRPREAMTSPEALLGLLNENSWVVTKLLDIAKSGIRFVGFKNERIDELAATIATIVAENNYLKSLLGTARPSVIKTTNDGVTVSFGPRNEYNLFMATPTQETRNTLAENLIAAGKELQRINVTVLNQQQQVLPFDK